MLATGLLLTFALTSIEPIITVYVALFAAPIAGDVRLRLRHVGRRARRRSVVGRGSAGSPTGSATGGSSSCRSRRAALLLVPQAFVAASWQLVALRFLLGLALGGLAARHRQRHPPQRARDDRRRPAWLVGLGAICRAGAGAARRRFCRRPHRHARRLPRHRRPDGGGGARRISWSSGPFARRSGDRKQVNLKAWGAASFPPR